MDEKQVRKALASWEEAKMGTSGDAEYESALEMENLLREWLSESKSLFTKEQVIAALNRAADAIADSDRYESSETLRDDDLVNLIVNLAGHWLEHPEASRDEAIAAQYEGVEPDDYNLDDGEEYPEKGTPRWNELVAKTVMGWIE